MMGQTSNYQWKQPEYWEEADRQDWNETLSAIDAAVAAKADSSGVDSRFAAVDGRLAEVDGQMAALEVSLDEKSVLVTGTYIGNGVAKKTISLGFQPQAVLVEYVGGLRSSDSGGALGGAAILVDSSVNVSDNAVTVTSSGFQIFEDTGSRETNRAGYRYNYLAFR